MKKIVLTSFLLLSLAFCFSQGYETTRYGVRAGVNISNLDFDPAPVSRNMHRNGFYFGGFAEFSLSETLWLNTELQWSAEGAKEEDWRANYLNLPIQLRFQIGNNFMIGAGPQIGVKTWKSADAYDTIRFSGVGGIEYKFLEDYFIDVRAGYDFKNLLDESLAPLEATQFTIQVGVGIKI
ncbi:outer membrane protein with beta-barrel domain [Winogradskyella wandonensis]|uniref:Outer membrane protein with beta-barrel domain n=1 Tax=Winogradskyella wandonensis TaxID=1442586 RepID=A0A4V2PU47_9FLAO|nr:porin family protein [Winogradskyella wandonensis]TCK69101.1 outer membrane protein with beta-barrel domain [Winogradskyella wandonensis]